MMVLVSIAYFRFLSRKRATSSNRACQVDARYLYHHLDMNFREQKLQFALGDFISDVHK
jgi:hypothetical protein